MQSNKKGLLFPLLALGELVVIIVLAKASCNHGAIHNEPPPNTREVYELPKNTGDYRPVCANDDDCPSDSSCLRGACVVTGPTDTVEEDEYGLDAGNGQENIRSCETAEDCGCGYDCADDSRCQKSNTYCCANADCKEGDFCHFSEGESDPNGTCMLSECDDNDDCGQCGVRCFHHLCDQAYCCVDGDCPTEKLCVIFDGNTEGFCVIPQCKSDADCGCGYICNTFHHACTRYSPDRPIQCCDTDFYYGGQCLPHEYIENGSCLDDTHCPVGKVCADDETCRPKTCVKNSDCGCEHVCRKDGCESGCDTNSDCCDKDYPVCDRGDCISADTEEDDEEE